MLSPAPEISSAKKKVIFDSNVMRCTIEHLQAIKKRSKDIDNSVLVSSKAVQLFTVANTIGGSNLLPVLYENNLLAECPKVNMLEGKSFQPSI